MMGALALATFWLIFFTALVGVGAWIVKEICDGHQREYEEEVMRQRKWAAPPNAPTWRKQ